MPHRVVNFFRSSSSSLEDNVSGVKASVPRTSSHSRAPHSPRMAPSVNDAPMDDSDGSASPIVRPLRKKDRTMSSSSTRSSIHRLSFPALHLPGKSHKTAPTPNVTLDWKIESPPVVFLGSPESSTGALVSGQVILNINEDPVDVAEFGAKLDIHVSQKRPFVSHCYDCANQFRELKRWQFLPGPMVLTKGQHMFPFSILLEGHLPATMDSPILAVSYEFKSVLTPTGPGAKPLKLERRLNVSRSIPPHETPHHSVRVFPPTKISASANYPHIIHPTGVETLSMHIEGLTSVTPRPGNHKEVEVWKLKRVKWSVEETVRTIAPACDKHSPPPPKDAPAGEAQKKGMLRSETRVLAWDESTRGWKADYDAGTIDLEIEYSAASAAPHGAAGPSGSASAASCDARSRDGTEVTHSVAVELVVVHESAEMPRYVTATGTARVLRMHFATVITARAGLGVSWDNEMPPIYQDVPPSPPKYPADRLAPQLTSSSTSSSSSAAPAAAPALSRQGSTANGTIEDEPVPYDLLERLEGRTARLSLDDLEVGRPGEPQRGESSGTNHA